MSQGVQHVGHALTILGAGAAVPTLSEGDPNGSYFTIARTGVGTYTLTTKDPFIALVAAKVQAIGLTYASVGATPVKNANNTYTITIWNFATPGGVAADVVAAVPLYIYATFRNSSSLP